MCLLLFLLLLLLFLCSRISTVSIFDEITDIQWNEAGVFRGRGPRLFSVNSDCEFVYEKVDPWDGVFVPGSRHLTYDEYSNVCNMFSSALNTTFSSCSGILVAFMWKHRTDEFREAKNQLIACLHDRRLKYAAQMEDQHRKLAEQQKKIADLGLKYGFTTPWSRTSLKSVNTSTVNMWEA